MGRRLTNGSGGRNCTSLRPGESTKSVPAGKGATSVRPGESRRVAGKGESRRVGLAMSAMSVAVFGADYAAGPASPQSKAQTADAELPRMVRGDGLDARSLSWSGEAMSAKSVAVFGADYAAGPASPQTWAQSKGQTADAELPRMIGFQRCSDEYHRYINLAALYLAPMS